MHNLQNPWKFIIGVSPALLIYTIFCVVPIFISFYYSFMQWDGFSPMEFIGISNYTQILSDSVFWLSVRNNIIVVLASVFGQIPIGLGLALLLNRKLKGAKIFRTIGFLPVIISTVIVSLTWSMVYRTEAGLINSILSAIGLDGLTQNWLGNTDLAMGSVAVVVIWQFVGLYFIIFLAALQTVPKEVLEAAEIDGATGWQKTRYVTLPSISGVILVCIVLCISGSLKTFDLMFVMTGGGPAHATEVMATYMYNQTFTSLRFGYGSAISVMIFIFSIVLIVLVQRLLGTKRA